MSGEGSERAVLGGGCFWCLEAVFEQVEGVRAVKSGYAGGSTPEPTYEQVCSGSTGHAEVVAVDFDPDVIAFREILEIFFAIHDPTTLNRQGADRGTQYRSAVYTTSDAQAETARALVDELEGQGLWDDPVVTEIEPLDRFWPAEDKHDTYYRRNQDQPYCRAVISPKVAKFRQKFAHRLVRAGLAVLAALALGAPLAAQSAARTSTGPLLADYGPAYAIPDPDFPTETARELRAVFDVTAASDDPSGVNRRIESLARYLNMHAQAGVPAANMKLALVLHGSAGRDALDDEGYRARYGVDNPNAPLLQALADLGVDIVLCGQTQSARGFARGELAAPVQVALSAMTALVDLQSRGYALIAF